MCASRKPDPPEDQKKEYPPDAGADKQTPQVSPTKQQKITQPAHLGSSNAFEETENPASPDPDNITDEKLDEWLEE